MALRLIDVHHHVVLPAYEQALVRAGAGDPSKPLRKNSIPAAAIEAMNTFGIAQAIINPLSVAGVHHGNDANARFLCESVAEALAHFVSEAPATLGFFAPLPFPDIDGALAPNGARARPPRRRRRDPAEQPERRLCHLSGEALWAEMNRRRGACLIHPARHAFVDILALKLLPAIIEYPASNGSWPMPAAACRIRRIAST